MDNTRWVFGYGSLMWNPGFPALRAQPAKLEGYHRSLCVLSHRYRGTADCHGLVFGLDGGGTCHGLAFEIDGKDHDSTLAYLRERELVSHAYLERRLPVTLEPGGEIVQAITYIVDTRHQQYAGKLQIDEVLRYIRQGRGIAGSCADYVRNTHAHLSQLGVSDDYLERIVARLP